MKILLTGAGGFTGKHFSMIALDKGHEVLPLRSDLLDVEGIRKELIELKPDAVLHLAAITFVDYFDQTELYQVNTIGTKNLLDGLSKLSCPPNKTLLVSTANLYGNSSSEYISEAAELRPANHYSVSKLSMEYLSQLYFDIIPVTIARPFNYTGRGQSEKFLVPKLVDHFKNRRPILSLGNQYIQREFNDVRFVCEAYLSLLMSGSNSEIYNVCTGRSYSLKFLIDQLTALSGHHSEFFTDPLLVRNNEIERLAGDCSKLMNLGGISDSYTLEQTLRWMLD